MDPGGIATILGLSAGGAAVAAKMLDKLLGPSLESIGGGIAAPLIAWKEARVQRAREVLERAAAVVVEHGGSVHPVPGRVLWPILEKSSLEEDLDLRTLWVQLLATAAEREESVSPAFAHILSELSPEDARFLQYIYSRVEAERRSFFGVGSLIGAYGLPIGVGLDNLARLRLIDLLPAIRERDQVGSSGPLEISHSHRGRDLVLAPGYSDMVHITKLGYEFVLACRGTALPAG